MASRKRKPAGKSQPAKSGKAAKKSRKPATRKRKKATGKGKAKADKRSQPQRAKDAEKLAKELEEQERGPAGGDRYEQVQRDLTIFRGYLRGLQPETLAATYQLEVRTVKEIVKRMGREARRITDQDPIEIIEEYVWRIEAAIDELATVAAKEDGSARVTAIKARLDAMRDKFQTLQSVGILPHDLGTLGIRLDLQTMFREIADVLTAEGVGEEVILKIAEKLSPAVDSGSDVSTERPALPAG